MKKILVYLVGFFAALFAAPTSVAAAPSNAGTTAFTGMLASLSILARPVLRGMMHVQFAVDRIFGMRTPFALADAPGIDAQIAKSLETLSAKLDKVGQLEKSLADAKAAQEATTKTLATLQEQQLALQKAQLEVTTLEAPRAKIVYGGRDAGTVHVSDGLAKHLAAQFILHCEISGKSEALCSVSEQREKLLAVAKRVVGGAPVGKTALSTSDIPLPVSYSSEMKELISEFGVCRRRMSPYPIGMGTARPARWGTRPAFGSIAMSASITEKSPTLSFASLESHKVGGLVRLPREIDEQSIVPMGQFLARYGAVEFARAEDTWGFLADGTSTYESVSGVVDVATDNSKSVVLAAATGPHDATLADFRAMRTKVNKAALSGRLSAYYMDSTWETRLPTFKTEADPFAYVRNPDGTATLDGYPIVWTDVLEAYGTADVTSKPLACFGALNFWWMGEHGAPRIDTSEHVFFANDQLAVRFIEEIDFDYAALDAMSVLLTGAAS